MTAEDFNPLGMRSEPGPCRQDHTHGRSCKIEVLPKQENCGAKFSYAEDKADEDTVCTFPKGHGRVEIDDGQGEADHGDPDRGIWWEEPSDDVSLDRAMEVYDRDQRLIKRLRGEIRLIKKLQGGGFNERYDTVLDILWSTPELARVQPPALRSLATRIAQTLRPPQEATSDPQSDEQPPEAPEIRVEYVVQRYGLPENAYGEVIGMIPGWNNVLAFPELSIEDDYLLEFVESSRRAYAPDPVRLVKKTVTTVTEEIPE